MFSCWCYKHHFGEVKDGYQYCAKCGIARSVLCNHKWKTIGNSQIVRKPFGKVDNNDCQRVIGEIYILQCEKCGEILEKKIDCLLA